MSATNLGRSINLISGVNGVSTGGQAVWLPPLNRRYHRHSIKCAGISLAGGTNLASVAISTTGTGLKLDTTIGANGSATAVAIHSGAAGTGYTAGDTVTWADANYPTASGYVNPVTVTVATVSSGVPQTLTFAQVAQPTQPALVLNTVRQLVAGVVMRDITPAQTMGMIAANPFPKAYSLQPGELPIIYTEPWRNVLRRNDAQSWDVFYQPTFEIDFGISSACSSPAITGSMEFDYQRNVKTIQGKMQLSLDPVKHKGFTIPIPAGQYDWTTLPINYPIARIWLIGSTPGAITRLEVYQDGNKVMESYTPEIVEMYGEYGFNIGGLSNTANTNSTTWDAAYISDPDQRYGRYLVCSNSLILRVYSNAAQNLTAILESAPGAYV